MPDEARVDIDYSDFWKALLQVLCSFAAVFLMWSYLAAAAVYGVAAGRFPSNGFNAMVAALIVAGALKLVGKPPWQVLALVWTTGITLACLALAMNTLGGIASMKGWIGALLGWLGLLLCVARLAHAGLTLYDLSDGFGKRR